MSALFTPVPARVLGALGIAAAVALTGCSSAVDVSAAPGAGSPGCLEAAQAWPGTVSGLERREVAGGARGAAAWGDPPIIARCGVAAVGPTTAGCLEVDGVGWVGEELSDGTRMTTFGTDPAIEVLVPGAYGEAGMHLPVFTAAAKALPTNGLHCR